MRAVHKDTSGLVNPLLFRRLDGREFSFLTIIRDDKFQTRVYDHENKSYLEDLTYNCGSAQGVNDYIDSVLTSKSLSKAK